MTTKVKEKKLVGLVKTDPKKQERRKELYVLESIISPGEF